MSDTQVVGLLEGNLFLYTSNGQYLDFDTVIRSDTVFFNAELGKGFDQRNPFRYRFKTPFDKNPRIRYLDVATGIYSNIDKNLSDVLVNGIDENGNLVATRIRVVFQIRGGTIYITIFGRYGTYSGLNLSQTNFSYIDESDSAMDLRNTDFRGTILDRCDFNGAHVADMLIDKHTSVVSATFYKVKGQIKYQQQGSTLPISTIDGFCETLHYLYVKLNPTTEPDYNLNCYLRTKVVSGAALSIRELKIRIPQTRIIKKVYMMTQQPSTIFSITDEFVEVNNLKSHSNDIYEDTRFVVAYSVFSRLNSNQRVDLHKLAQAKQYPRRLSDTNLEAIRDLVPLNTIEFKDYTDNGWICQYINVQNPGNSQVKFENIYPRILISQKPGDNQSPFMVVNQGSTENVIGVEYNTDALISPNVNAIIIDGFMTNDPNFISKNTSLNNASVIYKRATPVKNPLMNPYISRNLNFNNEFKTSTTSNVYKPLSVKIGTIQTIPDRVIPRNIDNIAYDKKIRPKPIRVIQQPTTVHI